MIQIRNSIFETNSSSVHSLVFMAENEYNRFLAGEVVYDRYTGKFISRYLADIPDDDVDDDFYSPRYLDKNNLARYASEFLGGSGYVETRTTPDGHPVYYLCYYGRD